MTGIEDRLIVGNENIKKILTIKTDYSLVRERLRKNIGESYKYLTVALENKRGDGQYGRVYFAYLDAEGKAHKPFVLPQSDPEKDDLTLKSYNIPDLSATPVPFDASSIKRINRQLKAEEFK